MPGFSETCEKITIAKGVLSAQCKKADGKHFVHSSISLNDYIGNKDGHLTWGAKGFSHHAADVHVNAQGILSAKLKGPGEKLVESKLDLNAHIRNNDGVLEPVLVAAAAAADASKVVAPGLAHSSSIASTASSAGASSMFSSISASSASSVKSSSSVVKTVSSSSSSSSSFFHSSKFRTTSKLLLIEATCSNLVLKGHVLHLDCQRLDGSIHHSSIDLNTIIGFVNGRLEWDHSGFTKHVVSYHLEGFILVVKFKVGGTEHVAHLDLRARLRNSDGVIILMELNRKLGTMLSEVPWMKFKVIAEPDLSVFARHPVMQETLVRIAETTVEHVTNEMHKQLTIAMETAISVITASAMSHVQSQMEALVMDVAGQASASASITGAESLHLFGQGGYGFSGYAAGGYAANGYAANGYAANGYAAGEYSAGGYSAGGYYTASAMSSPGLATPGLPAPRGGAKANGVNGTNGHGPHIVSASSTPLQSPAIQASEAHGHGHGILAEVAHAAKHMLHLDQPQAQAADA